MVVAKNFIDIPENLRKILFREETLLDIPQSDMVKKLYAKLSGNNYHVLNYYEFNILIHQTRGQVTNFHKLNDEFFESLSAHKNKMCFCGFFDGNDNTFTPSEVIYHLPYGNLGIYVRKNIVKAFKDNDIEIGLMGNVNKDTLTRFVIL